jgi:hypothetical protein
MAPQPLDRTKTKANSTKHLVENITDLILNDIIPIILHEAGKNARLGQFPVASSWHCFFLKDRF